MKINIKELLKTNSTIVENELSRYISLYHGFGLSDVMSYSLLMGGKRIRPFLVIETYKAFSNNDDLKKALPFACALEMIHTYSLIHDDMPCMDNDNYRRGKLTNHMVYGEGKALLAGDTLLTYAFEVLSCNQYVSDTSIKHATQIMSKCAGSMGMAGGQMIDLDSGTNISSFDELKNMHTLKTGALIKAGVLLGYFASTDKFDEKIIENLTKYANNIGIAFQIKDDILDVVSNKDTLGKEIGSDLKNGKKTTLSFMSIEEAQNQINILTNEAIEAIDICLGEKGCVLIELAKYLIEREN